MSKRRHSKPRVKEAFEYVSVQGSKITWSDLSLNKGARIVHPTGPTLMRLWVRSRSHANPGELDRAFIRMAKQPISRRRYWSHGKLIARFGADPKDMDAIEEYAAKFKLCVKRRDPSMQMMELWGSRSDFSQAFKISWLKYSHREDAPGDEPYGRIGDVQVPKELEGIILRVMDQNDPHTKLTRIRPTSAEREHEDKRWRELEKEAKLRRRLHSKSNGRSSPTWTGNRIAQHYRFPEKWNGITLSGKGQTIALIELGQGYLPQDVEEFFGRLKLPVPTVVAATRDAGKNNWQNTGGEVLTDIDVVGAVAPNARQVVYFGERATADELLDVVSMAVFDRERKPSVISISWGFPEHLVHRQHSNLIEEMGDLFKKAALLGITICVAAGDNGSLDMVPGSDAAAEDNDDLQVDFPACLEACLACGGTWISDGREMVWNESDGIHATGGGVSRFVPRPFYQNKAGIAPSPEKNEVLGQGRGVPDVAGIAYNHMVIKRGESMYMRGTSFVAPFWAALIARLNQANGKRVGFINNLLYDNPSVCKSITYGHNDILNKQAPFIYQAANGWDAVTGLGVPNGPELLKVVLKQNGKAKRK